MAYVAPNTIIFQDFTRRTAANEVGRRALIAGPHAYLLRYSDTAVREDAFLGYYDAEVDTDYAWPNRPAGGLVDSAYSKLFIQDALLRYYDDSISSGSTVTKTAGYNNRIRSATRSFVSNDVADRYSGLLDRDVKVGDVAKVRGVAIDSTPITLWTYVKSLIADVVAASVGSAVADTDNPSTQSVAVLTEKTAGAVNCVFAAADASAYDGLPSGDIDEIYDVIVTESSVGGDFTTAVLRVISGSGRDDQSSVVPAAAGDPTDIGSRGLVVVFDKSADSGLSASAVDGEVAPDDLIAGQRWRITVDDNFTKPVATAGGTYDSADDETYIVTVTRGGLYASDTDPQISVTTLRGTDISGPTTVTAATTDVAVGNRGVLIRFTGTGLRKGDKYYIECTGESDGAIKTIELGHNLSTDIPEDSEVGVTLYIRNPLLEVPANRTDHAPLTNFDSGETEVTINSGIVAFDSTWTDGGVEVELPVFSESSKRYGRMYIEYRAWLPTLADDVRYAVDDTDLDTLISGPIHPDNPLKWGVFKALQMANSSPVGFTSVADPDSADSWAELLEILGRDEYPYDLVPLTRDATVLALFQAHVAAASGPTVGLERRLWISLDAVPYLPLVHAGTTVPGSTEATTTDGEEALALIEETDTDSYLTVRVTSGNSDFVANGVRPGDIVRCLFSGDGFGGETYQSFVIDDVEAEDQLRLVSGPDAAVNVAAKIEVWRTLDGEGEANAVALNAGAWASRRVMAVWPDEIESSGTIMPGYFACATYAGFCSGILPNQGVTNFAITGYTAVPRTTVRFTNAQLDHMAENGVFIITQDRVSGSVFCRHAVTTNSATGDVNQREEMVTRNVDDVVKTLRAEFQPFIGVTNVTDYIVEQIRLRLKNVLTAMETDITSTRLGAQIVSATIVSVAKSDTFADQIDIDIDCVFPAPLNRLQIRITV